MRHHVLQVEYHTNKMPAATPAATAGPAAADRRLAATASALATGGSAPAALPAVSSTTASGSAPAPRRPHICFVLTDDQGYGELGCHGQHWPWAARAFNLRTLPLLLHILKPLLGREGSAAD